MSKKKNRTFRITKFHPALLYLGVPIGIPLYLRKSGKSENYLNLLQLDQVEVHLEELRDMVLQNCRFVIYPLTDGT